ncbi:Solute-binding protein [bioreactor metagenome]|uniref:Solute-binding protein n=1 Tax=bioreactor metagenome TaxID=1076179 RepID=A0A645I9P1_9ZZZZ
MPSPVESQVWTALGAKPTTVPFGEVYTALQTNMVEGAENTLSSYYSAKHYEVAKYLNETFHQWSIVCIWASDATMAKLPADLQQVVRDAAKETAVYGFKAQLDNDAKFKDALIKAGVTFTEVDIKPWAEKVKPIQDNIAKQYKTEDVLARIRELA